MIATLPRNITLHVRLRSLMAQDSMLIYTIKIRMYVASTFLLICPRENAKPTFQITCDLQLFDIYKHKVYHIGIKRANTDD